MTALENQTLTLPRPPKQTLSQFSFDGVVWALWRKGYNTADISKVMGQLDYPESHVANSLARLRDAEPR